MRTSAVDFYDTLPAPAVQAFPAALQENCKVWGLVRVSARWRCVWGDILAENVDLSSAPLAWQVLLGVCLRKRLAVN